MQFLDNAMILAKESARVAGKLPKKYRFTVGQRLSDLGWLIIDHVKTGNGISNPKNMQEAEDRSDEFQMALNILNTSYITTVECAKQLDGISYKDMERLMYHADYEIKLLKGVMRSDKQKYIKQFSGS